MHFNIIQYLNISWELQIIVLNQPTLYKEANQMNTPHNYNKLQYDHLNVATCSNK